MITSLLFFVLKNVKKSQFICSHLDDIIIHDKISRNFGKIRPIFKFIYLHVVKLLKNELLLVGKLKAWTLFVHQKIEISSHSGYWFSADINNFFSILLISLFSYFFYIFYPEVFFWAIMQRHNVFSFTKLTIFVFKKIAYVSKNQIHKKKTHFR